MVVVSGGGAGYSTKTNDRNPAALTGWAGLPPLPVLPDLSARPVLPPLPLLPVLPPLSVLPLLPPSFSFSSFSSSSHSSSCSSFLPVFPVVLINLRHVVVTGPRLHRPFPQDCTDQEILHHCHELMTQKQTRKSERSESTVGQSSGAV